MSTYRFAGLAGALNFLVGALAGCATSTPDGYVARSRGYDSQIAELLGTPRASSSVITAADLAALPPTYSVEEVLAHWAGMYLRRRNEPGGEMTIYVLGEANPLYVVDGVPLLVEGNLPLNTRDVERIEILKYGASVALYGLRGSNGVILITTRKGPD